jgi:hypothetical protein
VLDDFAVCDLLDRSASKLRRAPMGDEGLITSASFDPLERYAPVGR